MAILFLLLHAGNSRAQPRDGSVLPRPTIPILDVLQHHSLPTGTFQRWCGLTDRFLMSGNGAGLKLYDAAGKSSTISGLEWDKLQCGDDGRYLIATHSDKTGKNQTISGIEIASGAKWDLASFEGDMLVVFSPDLKSVATDGQLNLAAAVAGIKVVQLKMSAGNSVNYIKWSGDSSELFVVVNHELTLDETIEVIDTDNRKLSGGNVPTGFTVHDGWFDADEQNLTLLLASYDDEYGERFIYTCAVEKWRCDRTMDRVLMASSDGRGMVGTVRAQGKAGVIGGDAETYPS